MKNIKILIIICLIIIFIITFLIFLFDTYNNMKIENQINNIAEGGTVIDLELDTSIKKVENKDLYFRILKNIDIYVKAVKEKKAETVYNLLDNKYKENKNITIDNVFSKIEEPDMSENIFDIYILPINETKSIYFAYEIYNDYKITITLDMANNAIAFSDYGEIFNDLLDYEQLNIPQIKDSSLLENYEISVTTNDYNSYSEISEIYASEKYFEHYTNLLKEEKYEIAYELLSEEYKNLKFNNDIENFKEYLKNTNYIYDAFIKQTEEAENTYYIYDENGKTYIFTEKEPGKYNVMLDNYTVVSEEEEYQYIKLNVFEKVEYNIQKFIDMINNQDYETAYNKIDTYFKNKNFKTKQEFEEFISENFYKNNEVEFMEGEQKEDAYIYSIQIIDADKNNKEEIPLTIIMKLEEGTDFVISFSI